MELGSGLGGTCEERSSKDQVKEQGRKKELKDQVKEAKKEKLRSEELIL